ncbi:hypothetical protein ACFT7U_22205 [Streptomyces rochei]|uniref:hypothetical protein n=1 Tax=Streptomyces rochei TaxID=1928 RepID=UPI003632603A
MTGRFDADWYVLERAGANPSALDAGRRGLAGTFGFDEGHCALAMVCAPRHLIAAGCWRQAAIPDRRVLLPPAVSGAAAKGATLNGARALDRGTCRPGPWKEGR